MNEEFQAPLPPTPNPTKEEELRLQLNAAYEKISELDEEHTKLGSILIDIAQLLGVYPYGGLSVKKVIQDTFNNNHIFEVFQSVISNLERVENLLESVIQTNPTQSTNKSKINLIIPCRHVNGTLQIAYLRDVQGIGHTFDHGGHVAFYINVEIDEYLLNQIPPTVSGKIQK